MVPSIETENADPTSRQGSRLGSLRTLVDKTRGPWRPAAGREHDLIFPSTHRERPASATCQIYAFGSDDVSAPAEALVRVRAPHRDRASCPRMPPDLPQRACAVVLSSLRTRARQRDAADEYVRRLTFVYARSATGGLSSDHNSTLIRRRAGSVARAARDDGRGRRRRRAVPMESSASATRSSPGLSDDVVYSTTWCATLHLFSPASAKTLTSSATRSWWSTGNTLDPTASCIPTTASATSPIPASYPRKWPGPAFEHDAYAAACTACAVFFFDDCRVILYACVRQRVLGTTASTTAVSS